MATPPSSPCSVCGRFLEGGGGGRGSSTDANDDAKQNDQQISLSEQSEAISNHPTCCPICLGLWSENGSLLFQQRLKEAVRRAMEPYGGITNNNKFSRVQSPPMIMLPGDLVYRFHARLQQQQQGSKSNRGHSPSSYSPSLIMAFGQELKQHAKSVLETCLKEIENEASEDDKAGNNNDVYPDCIEQEELGYLGVHVLAIPTEGVYRPRHMMPAPIRQRRRHRHNHMTPGETSQGGDSRLNLERRVLRKTAAVHSTGRLWTLNQALDACELKKLTLPHNDDGSTHDKAEASTSMELLQSFPATTRPFFLDLHVAIWRRPFYLRGLYTKTRRDVSQTPFYVVDNHKRRKLGVTSVEEQIVPTVVQACRGISELNNDHDDNIKNNNNTIVFGKAKFHASGREDMDVRMLLPDNVPITASATDTAKTINKKTTAITGRPFCLEIYDALRLPSVKSLPTMVQEINHTTMEIKADDNKDDKSNHGNANPRSYGRNPLGVDISSDFAFVSSSYFKNLQSETEDKVKHYGCRCWSKEVLPATVEELNQKLGASSSPSSSYPLEIKQRTPLRVLHRRSNLVRVRHVLTCQATRIDDHYFQLHLSTSAGTYVKEFVHGDLGRTIPSVRSLLGCRTDILELDCEGIQR